MRYFPCEHCPLNPCEIKAGVQEKIRGAGLSSVRINCHRFKNELFQRGQEVRLNAASHFPKWRLQMLGYSNDPAIFLGIDRRTMKAKICYTTLQPEFSDEDGSVTYCSNIQYIYPRYLEGLDKTHELCPCGNPKNEDGSCFLPLFYSRTDPQYESRFYCFSKPDMPLMSSVLAGEREGR